MEYFQTTVILISLVIIQVGLTIRKIIDEKAISKKMEKAKELYPEATIGQIESFIKNTKEKFSLTKLNRINGNKIL